jgi:hypothetical protein
MKEQKIKKYKLMLKTHNKTGKKYLCITKKDKWEEYPGSGAQWRKHCTKHGFDLSTDLLFTTDDYLEFVFVCIFYSIELDIVLSEEFANSIPEVGYDNHFLNLTGKSNLELWWDYATDEMKKEVIRKRNKSISKNHFTKNENRESTLKKISESNKLYWKNLSLDERKSSLENMWEGFRKFIDDKDENYETWKSNISKSLLKYHEDVDPKIISERNRKARLNTSPESKERRKKKIQANHATGKYQHIWDKMSEDRKGSGNPAAKNIMWMGVIYNKMNFEKEIGKIDSKLVLENIEKRDDCYFMFDVNDVKTYECLTCPHCLKSSEGKKPSTFKRWHFDNCKEKKE